MSLILYSILFHQPMSVLLPVPHCLYYCLFRVSPQLKQWESTNFVVFQNCFGYSTFFAFPYKFQNYLSISTYKGKMLLCLFSILNTSLLTLWSPDVQRFFFPSSNNSVIPAEYLTIQFSSYTMYLEIVSDSTGQGSIPQHSPPALPPVPITSPVVTCASDRLAIKWWFPTQV